MIEFFVNQNNREVKELLIKLSAALRSDAPAIIAETGAKLTRSHITGIARSRHRSRAPRNFYQDAADSVVSRVVTDGAEISIPHIGFALRYHGGTVRPSGRISAITGRPIKRLAIPFSGSEAEGKNPGDFDNVFFVKGRNGKGFLAAKKGSGMIGMLFALVLKTEHDPDPSILPKDSDYQTNAEHALNALIKEVTR